MAFIGAISLIAVLFFVVMAIVPPIRRKISPKFTLKKSLLFGLIGFIIMVIAVANTDSPDDTTNAITNVDKAVVETESETNVDPIKEPVKEETVVEANSTPEPTIESTPEPTIKETASQRNAVRAAKAYIDFTAFSRKGLIEQLVFEGYSDADAEYAVDQINADWNEQAVLAAINYLDFSSFSKQGLIDQLVFEGYTSEQAEYGANRAYQ